MANHYNQTNQGQMICPHCGSTNVAAQPVTETYTEDKIKTKGFGCIKSFFGFIFFGVYGLLCGLCGMGKTKNKSRTTTRVKVVKICQNCGTRF